MVKRLKKWYQTWLDGTTRPVFEEHKPLLSSAEHSAFFDDEPDWGPAAPQQPSDVDLASRHRTTSLALRELKSTLETAEELQQQFDEPGPVTHLERPYTRELGPIATELLEDLDRTFRELLAEKRQQGQWRETMLARRSSRNQHAAMVDVQHLWRDGDDLDAEETVVPALVGAILNRARHASDTEAPTGLIPVTTAGTTMDEEPDS
jgi:hypothetical protein